MVETKVTLQGAAREVITMSIPDNNNAKARPKGLRVGNYRITPLGLVTFSVLLLLIVAAVIFFVVKPTDLKSWPLLAGGTTATPEPAETPDEESETALETPEPSAEPTPVPDARSATIRALGEIAMEQNLLRSAVSGNSFNFEDMFSEISDIMGNADYTIADVEGSMGDTTDFTGKNGKLVTPSSLISVLRDCGVDMLNLANDHALDGGAKDLMATMKNCTSLGMDYIGAATSEKAKKTPVIKDINGIKVAFLAYTEKLNNKPKKNSAVLKYGINLITSSNAAQDVKRARKAGADVIVCCVSWGKMFSRKATDNQQKIAKALNKLGVDVIIGYNPHVVQPAVWMESTGSNGAVHRTLCLGAAGNFLSDQRNQYSDSGIVFQFTIQETGPASGKFSITSPTYIPTYVWRKSTGDNKYQYRVMPVGRWREDQPSGMAYVDTTRMRQVWTEVQNIMGSSVAKVSPE